MSHGQPGVLDVAAGVILNETGQVLIAQRADHLHQGGLWEFPGGKLEPGEAPRQALERELWEELAIRVEDASPLITVRYDYPDRCVRLHVWRVERFSGIPRGMQGQPIGWVSKSDLPRFEFPSANQAIVTAARLPDCYAIVDVSAGDSCVILERIVEYANRGIVMMRLRAPRFWSENYATLARQAAVLCKGCGIALLVDGSASLLKATGAAGIHLRSDELMGLTSRPVGVGFWVAASCHDAEQLRQASCIGADFVVLGPVLPTLTHPDAKPLGWKKFSKLLESVTLPAFALGGLSELHLTEAKRAGAQGIAAIRGLS